MRDRMQYLVKSSERADGSVMHTVIYVECDCSSIPVVLPFHGGRCKRCGVDYA
jgi:hypothetical protein